MKTVPEKKVQQTFLKSGKRYMMIKRPHPSSQIKKLKEKYFHGGKKIKRKNQQKLAICLKKDDFQLNLIKTAEISL